jgi:type I restriction enzyme S subunit
LQKANLEKLNTAGGVPSLTQAVLNHVSIPVPPLPIQEEIVRILDTFTELIAELTAELTARKRQYEYYRAELVLNKQSPKNKELLLGDIGPVSMCKRIMKNETSSIEKIPFYKIGTFGNTPNAFISEETYAKYKEKYPFPKKGDVLISAAGTIGRTVIYDGNPSYYQDSNIVWIDNTEAQVLNKYLYYYYQLKPWRESKGGTISRLYNNDIRRTKIIVPPKKIQEQIIAVLDHFDAICNDLSSGLPAEIEARKKQYEYYRDKLLSFNERKAE